MSSGDIPATSAAATCDGLVGGYWFRGEGAAGLDLGPRTEDPTSGLSGYRLEADAPVGERLRRSAADPKCLERVDGGETF